MWKNGPPTATVGRPFLESPCEARSEFQDDPPLAHIESTKPEVESLVPGKELERSRSFARAPRFVVSPGRLRSQGAREGTNRG